MARQGFGGRLADGQWLRLVHSGRRKKHNPGETIVRQGETGATVHLLVDGKVKITATRAEGAETPLAFRGYGEILGEFAAWSGTPRAATAVAVETCRTRVFPSERFRSLVRELGMEEMVWENILARQRESDEVRAEQNTLPAGRRLAAALVRLARSLGDPIAPETNGHGDREKGVLLGVALPQQDIADYIGLSRTSVALEYTRLKEAGTIRTGRKYVAIRDFAALERMAYGDNM